MEIWVCGPVIDIVLRGPDSGTEPVRLQAIIDTGASGIFIDRRMAVRLGLVANHRVPVRMADGSNAQGTAYRAEMRIEGLKFQDWVEVIGVDMKFPNTPVLLGRSFLRRYIINYDGPNELFHFYNASDGPASFYEEHDG